MTGGGVEILGWAARAVGLFYLAGHLDPSGANAFKFWHGRLTIDRYANPEVNWVCH